MSGRKSTTKLEAVNRAWLANILGMNSNGYAGIDIFDDVFGIELKCRLLDPKYTTSHTVHEYQINEFQEKNPGRELYWAFMQYTLSQPLRDIPHYLDPTAFITSREVYFREWEFIQQFQTKHPKTGPYRYVPKRAIINTEFETLKVESGRLFIPKESSLLNRFNPGIAIEAF